MPLIVTLIYKIQYELPIVMLFFVYIEMNHVRIKD